MGRVERTPTADLVRRWRELFRREPAEEAQENEASQNYGFTRDLNALAQAHRREAALQIEFAAICDELARRKCDPMSYED